MDQENDQILFTSTDIIKSGKEMNYISKMRNEITFQIEEIEDSRRYIQKFLMKDKELKYFVACMKHVLLHTDSLNIKNYSFKNINKKLKAIDIINTNDFVMFDHQVVNEEATIKSEAVQFSEIAEHELSNDSQNINNCHILDEQVERYDKTLQQPIVFESLKNRCSEMDSCKVNDEKEARDSTDIMQGGQQLNSAESLSSVESRNTKPFPSTIREPCEQKMRDSSLNENNSKCLNDYKECLAFDENTSQNYLDKNAEKMLDNRKLSITSFENQSHALGAINFKTQNVSNYSEITSRTGKIRINKIFSNLFLYKFDEMWSKSFLRRIDLLEKDKFVFRNKLCEDAIKQLNPESYWTWRRTYSNCISLFACNNKDFCVFMRKNKGEKQSIHVFDQIMRRETGDYFDKISVFKTIVSPYYYLMPNQNKEEYKQFLNSDDWIKKQDPMEYVLVMFFTFPQKIACTEVEEQEWF